MGTFVFYLLSLGAAALCTFAVLPWLSRCIGNRLLDKPGGLKKHANAVPVVGGCGIFIGLVAALLAVRFTTQFPSGTLHSLRGIILGGTIIFIMGLWDDFKKPQGLPVWAKLLLQAAATLCLIEYGIMIHVFPCVWVSYLLTFLWVVGLTNAFNLLDILDGLCTTQAMVCTLGLALIALPSEFIYVNFAALALLGACAAFLPFNFSSRHKVFLGDSGSNLLGFLIAALCLGTGYSRVSTWGFLAALLIVCVPIADIAFVTLTRLINGRNPLKGSPDHAALRLRAMGWTSRQIVCVFAVLSLAANALGFTVTVCSPEWVVAILLTAFVSAGLAGYWLLKKESDYAR
ncbi:MAG: undecaprenyl/decaprenyl-phosphate alpha-N-acetylglucosaminyl 1-phosphate transferase [Elusimicrobiaceae bacterium]|nr:undecaprenyl/decaprenyl-phosphate alpha-N-acetylglucosaminyl 1-phosphate transferase [Elusimicrobiaceae bacterium]